jgi:hypothetical protein
MLHGPTCGFHHHNNVKIIDTVLQSVGRCSGGWMLLLVYTINLKKKLTRSENVPTRSENVPQLHNSMGIAKKNFKKR